VNKIKTLPFKDLIAPITPEDFFSKHWEIHHLYIPRNKPSFYDGIFSLEDIDHAIASSSGVSQDNLAIIPPVGSNRNIERFIPSDAPMEKIYTEFSSGSTIRLMSVQQTWPPVATLAAVLSEAFSASVNINFYLTPPNSQGFPIHIDTHEVLVLQIEGHKEWHLYEAKYQLPVETLIHMGDMKAKIKSPLKEDEVNLREVIRMQQGDLLYIPRGVPHKAVSAEGASLHLTVGIYPLLWVDFMKAAIELLSVEEISLRRSILSGLPWSPNMKEEMVNCFYQQLKLIERAPFERALSTLKSASRLTRRHYPADGHFRQLTRLDKLKIGTLLIRRDGLECMVERATSTATIYFASNQMKGPVSIAPALEYVRDHEIFRVADLPQMRDEASRLVLAQRLVREGLLRALDDDE
jgi:ribosomal protein L16 Arg81 hydroxylase